MTGMTIGIVTGTTGTGIGTAADGATVRAGMDATAITGRVFT